MMLLATLLFTVMDSIAKSLTGELSGAAGDLGPVLLSVRADAAVDPAPWHRRSALDQAAWHPHRPRAAAHDLHLLHDHGDQHRAAGRRLHDHLHSALAGDDPVDPAAQGAGRLAAPDRGPGRLCRRADRVPADRGAGPLGDAAAADHRRLLRLLPDPHAQGQLRLARDRVHDAVLSGLGRRRGDDRDRAVLLAGRGARPTGRG